MKPGRARALTVAGSDPSGGAGVQADLKTFHHFGVYGMSALSLVTVQNTVGVSRVELLEPAFVAEQMHAALDDIGADAVKTGALGSAPIIEAVAAVLAAHPSLPLVVDPVMVSKHGKRLLDEAGLIALRDKLIPRALLLTPNLPEAEALLGAAPIDMEAAARALHRLGAHAVLLKGGHAGGDHSDDLLFDGERMVWLRAQRIDSVHTHGTGCTFSAAISALIGKGIALEDACRRAKAFILRAIEGAPGLGKGNGPVDHWAGSPLVRD